MRKIIFQLSKKQKDDIFFSMEYHVYWLLKSSCFEIFGGGKYGLFSKQKVDGDMIFIDYWKVLVLYFLEKENTVFFEPKSWWKDDIYWLLKSSSFELFDDWKYGLFFSQKVDGKIIFTWSFWGFYDILGLEKNGFSCSAINSYKVRFEKISIMICCIFIFTFSFIFISIHWSFKSFGKKFWSLSVAFADKVATGTFNFVSMILQIV